MKIVFCWGHHNMGNYIRKAENHCPRGTPLDRKGSWVGSLGQGWGPGIRKGLLGRKKHSVVPSSPIWECLWGFLDWVNWSGKIYPKCRQNTRFHRTWDSIASLTEWERGKQGEHQDVSFSAPWLWRQYDQLPSAPATLISLLWLRVPSDCKPKQPLLP